MAQSKRSPRAKRLNAKDDKTLVILSRMGLTDYESRVYLGILRFPGSRIPEISLATGVPQPKVYGTIKRLIERGLCETELGPVNTYSATPPKNAFVPLLEDLRDTHEIAKDIIKDLQREHSTPADALSAREGRIKLFQGKQATTRNFRFLLGGAQKEVVIVARLPLIVADDDDAMEQALKNGASVRILLEAPDSFDLSEEPAVARQVQMGVESRRLPHVPMRMGVFDRRYVLLPMVDPTQERDSAMMLEVRNEGLAAGLLDVFESYWTRARPIEGLKKRR